MVGLVIVSHSLALANALKQLVGQVVVNEIPVAVAAGTGPDRELFGTDAIEIMEAIQSVFSDDGVLVLMDLGSAVLSAEMALELLPEEVSAKVRICPAPVVEGAIAAAVQIGLGSSLETTCAEAVSALLPKTEHIAQIQQTPSPEPQSALKTETPATIEPEPQAQVELILQNLHGLHARPAARFVQLASQFEAEVQVKNLTNGKGPVSARSLNALATLGAVRDHKIRISASGGQAEQAIQALRELIEANFGEEVEPVTAPAQEPARLAQSPCEPIPISEGIALGPLWHLQVQAPTIPTGEAQDLDQEWQRLQAAIDRTKTEIRQRREKLAASLGQAEAEIFDAHLLILQDPDLLAAARQEIEESRQNAAAAWDAAVKSAAAEYQALEDPYLQQRAADVLDVGKQVLIALSGKSGTPVITIDRQVILFAEELTPTETSQLQMDKVLGVITASGGPTSHSAILSRALGIPAVSGVRTALSSVPDGTLVGMDGFNGKIWIDPQQDIQSELQSRRQVWLDRRQQLLELSGSQAATRDGHRIVVAANVGNTKDADAALKNGAEGIGLLRTEFLYLTRQTPPSEAEQIYSLQMIGAALAADGDASRSIIVRTLDVGGDKALPYLPLPAEDNPFLGVRAIRLSLRNRPLFRTQLRAVLQAGEKYQFRIMFPMVAILDEVLEARQMLVQVHQELAAEGLPHAWPVETGIMVEVPAAAVTSDRLAEQVDFFSIGTNDLTQYTLAAERGNPALAELNDALHPAVLKLVEQVARASHQYGKWTGVCGELAGDPVAIPVLVGLGVDELSMNPGAIPRAKAILRELDLPQMQALADQVKAAKNAHGARELAREFLQTHTTGMLS